MNLNCILIVDDDGTTNFINYLLIKQSGLARKIEIATNGEKALNFLNQYAENNDGLCPELIFLDFHMPIMDGFEFLEYLKIKKIKNKADVKIIALTNSPFNKIEEKLKEFPNLHFLEKPLTKEKMTKLITELNFI